MHFMFSVGVRLGTQKCLYKDFFPLKTSKQQHQNMYHNAYIKKLCRPLKLTKSVMSAYQDLPFHDWLWENSV